MHTGGAVQKTSKRRRRSFNIFRVLEWSATIFLFVVVALIVAGFFPVSHPWVTGKCVDLFLKNGADSCSIDNVSIVLWRGIECNNVKISKRISDREWYTCSFGKVTISINLVSLAINSKRPEGSLDGFQNDPLYSIFKDPVKRLAEGVRYFYSFEGLKGLLFEDVSFDVQLYDSTALQLQYGVFEIVQYQEKNLTEVKYQFGHFHYGTFSIQNSKGTASLDERFLRISRARGSFRNGKYRASADIDMRLPRLRGGQLALDEIPFESLFPVRDSSATTHDGTIDGEIRFDPSPFVIDSLQGVGEIILRNVNVSGDQVQRVISQMLSIPQMDTLQFYKIKNNFTLKKNLTFLNQTQANGSPVSFTSKGWIKFNGTLNQEIEGNINELLAKELPPLVYNSLEEGEKGARLFRCRVFGNYSAPRVELDSVILQRAVGNMFLDVRDNLKSLFRKKRLVE